MVGFLLVDKPAGCTSHDVVARLRRIAGGTRIGHAGTLDPLATGLLVCGVGQATRLLGRLQLDSKCYEATMRLGIVTDTQDITGATVDRCDGVQISPRTVALAAERFRGIIQQVPPAYSALKVGGLPAHRRMRRGMAYEPPPAREVVVHALEVLAVDRADVRFRIECGSGTYVRTICHDWGAALDVGGCLAALRRLWSGHFRVEDARPLEAFDTAAAVGACLRPVRDGFLDWPLRPCTPEEVESVRHGRYLPAEGRPAGERSCLALPGGEVFALAQVQEREDTLVLKAAPVLTNVIDNACRTTAS